MRQGRNLWITKPADLSKGRKIKISSALPDQQKDKSCVYQKYI